MIDVHILTLPERSHWRAECLASLQQQPVQVHMLDGIRGHVGEGRIRGYQQGHSEWVSFVDDDDRVLPGAFAHIFSELQKVPEADAAFTRERMMTESGQPIATSSGRDRSELPKIGLPLYCDKTVLFKGKGTYTNHLMVFRRKKLLDLILHSPTLPVAYDEWVRETFCTKHLAIAIPDVCYEWRRHPGCWGALHSRSKR